MDSAGKGTAYALLALIPVLIGLCEYFFRVKLDKDEPPLISPTIPYIGHAIGLLRQRMRYYNEVRKKHPLPICTLPILGGKVYIVNSPELVLAVQKQPKALNFGYIACKATPRMCHMSEHGLAVMNHHLNDGESQFLAEAFKILHELLAPGPVLDGMNRTMIDCVQKSVDGLNVLPGPKVVPLYDWIRHELAIASTDGIYGDQNPFRDPNVEADFWEWMQGLTVIMAGIYPSITARKAYQARERLAKIYTRWYETKGVEHATKLPQERLRVCLKYDIPQEDAARFELTGVMAIVLNSVPSIYWMTYDVFSRPKLVEALRAEALTVTTTTTRDDGTRLHTIDISSMKEKCKLLLSTFQESLRVRSFGSGVRQVMQDTWLADRYLLKQGSIVQMPSYSMHMDPTIWGPDVEEFDATRFLRKQPAGAFRGFGGGTTLCPGRHFAITEILAMTAMMLLRYDIRPVGGKWIAPELDAGNIAANVSPPLTDPPVEVRARKGFEHDAWQFELRDSKKRFELNAIG